jgi:OmpA-OmpF porin, OOP family
MKTAISFALLALLAATAAACAGETRQAAEPQLTASRPTETRGVGWPTLGNGTARFIRIDLGPDNFAECQRVSPKFPFDSASTYAQDREQLIALAACLNSPGMRERSIQLIGRADPRGTEAYNEKLGLKRATTIKQLLVDNGIAESRIELTTEGAKAALGDTPDTSAGYDRRVDVLVKGGTHTP